MAIILAAFLFILIHGAGAQYLVCANGGAGMCVGVCASGSQACITTMAGPVCCELAMIVTVTMPGTNTAPTPVISNPAITSPVISNPVITPPVITPPVPPVASQAGTTTCFDRVDPRTGVSDCPSKAHLCNNPLYANLMNEQCPLTCGRCTPNPVTPTCRDYVDPRTGVSNCPQMYAYCTNSLYQQLMKEQCPKTCGYCV